MINLGATLVEESSGLTFAQAVAVALENGAYPAFQKWAREIADTYVERQKGEPYTVTVDGKLASNLDGISVARRKVIVHFIQNALRVAVGELASILSESAKAKAVNWSKQRNNVASSVLVFYGGKGKPTRRISSYGEIEYFQPGDFIQITASNPWQQYLNTRTSDGQLRVNPGTGSRRHGKGGYFGLAARRIRSKLRATTRNASALWVGATRSRAVLSAIGMPDLKTEAGRANWHKLQYLGAWAITIRYNPRVLAGGLNNGR